MKKMIIISAILITGFFTSVKSETKIINHSGFEFGFFYSNLAPYGTWMEIDGLVVWRPTIMRRGWAPYMEGRWIWTVDGWYWDSYEPFGYIAFHYGRWYYDDYYGWIWVPDNEWAPAWVEWRYDNHYIGWAPLTPYAVFSISIGIHFTHDYYVPYTHWHYVNYNHFCDPYVYNYYVAPKYKYRIHNRTKVRNNYGYRNGHVVNKGVDIDLIRKRTGQNIRERQIVGVSDYREMEKYRNQKGNDDVVRTFIASKDELTRTRSNDVKIERKDKRSSLDVSKVRIGRDDVNTREREIITNKERSAGRDFETKKNDDVIRKNDVQIKRNETIKTERKNVDIIPEKNVDRRDVKSNNVNTQRNNDIRTNNEVKRETNNRINIQQQKKDVQKNEIQKKDVNIQKNNERKIEVRKESNNNRNIQQQNKVQVKTEQKRNDTQTRTRTQENRNEKKNNSDNNKKRSR